MSTSETCVQRLNLAAVDVDSTPLATTGQQLTLSYDLYRAIEDLRSVPALRWPPDDVTFDHDLDVVDPPAECNAVMTVSGNVDRSQLLQVNHTTATITTVTKVSVLSSELPHAAQTSAHNVERPPAAVNGDLTNANKYLSLPVVCQTGWAVRERVADGAYVQSSTDIIGGQTTVASDTRNEHLSGDDDVFVDVATPIDAELLIDDVYERGMEQLDQLDGDEVTAAEDWSNLPPDSVDQVICSDSADTQTNRLTESRHLELTDGSTEQRSFSPSGPAVELHCADTYRLDASAEEVFEEIVESMTDTVDEDDADLDALVDAGNQLTTYAATTTSEQLETAVDHISFGVSEKFSEDSVALPARSPLSPLNRRPGRKIQQDVTEQKRQKYLTVSLASTLNECLDALSQIDASNGLPDNVPRNATGVERYRRYDVTNGDVVNNATSAKSSLGRQCVTSSSSGFQSDLMDVDIDEEFDVNVALHVADADALMSGAKATSLDSLLETNDDDEEDDESYADQTIIRRPTPKLSVNHSVVNGSVEKPATSAQSVVEAEASGVAGDTTKDVQREKQDEDDVANTEHGTVISYEDASSTVKVLAEELITQEIVLNIVLPRRSKKKQKRRPGVEDGFTKDISESGESGVIDRRKSYKSPHRDFHIHRVVRCSDADQSDDRLAVSDRHTESKTAVAEAEGSAENINEDDSRIDSSARRKLSLVSCYVGGPLSVEMERNAESSTTESVDDETSLRVTRRQRFKVLRAPDGSGTALFNAPVTSVRNVLDDVGRTLVGDHRRQPLPLGARVTCEAVERKSSTSLPGDDDVTVVRRTIDSDVDRPMMLRTAIDQE